MKEMFEHQIGDMLVYKGARYQCVAVRPYTRKDGELTEIATMRALCADCGKPYEYETSRYYRSFSPIRRCKDHRRMGVRVRTAKFSL